MIKIQIGDCFGRLTVLEDTGKRGPAKEKIWRLKCGCGEQVEVRTSNLRSGNTRSCGCLNRERHRERFVIEVDGYRSGEHPLYRTWQGMKKRCLSPTHHQYKDYGGRGVTVCDRWLRSFKNFAEDMGERPEGYTLDREDNDKGYSPDNCRWASRLEQAQNKRKTRG